MSGRAEKDAAHGQIREKTSADAAAFIARIVTSVLRPGIVPLLLPASMTFPPSFPNDRMMDLRICLDHPHPLLYHVRACLSIGQNDGIFAHSPAPHRRSVRYPAIPVGENKNAARRCVFWHRGRHGTRAERGVKTALNGDGRESRPPAENKKISGEGLTNRGLCDILFKQSGCGSVR